MEARFLNYRQGRLFVLEVVMVTTESITGLTDDHRRLACAVITGEGVDGPTGGGAAIRVSRRYWAMQFRDGVESGAAGASCGGDAG